MIMKTWLVEEYHQRNRGSWTSRWIVMAETENDAMEKCNISRVFATTITELDLLVPYELPDLE